MKFKTILRPYLIRCSVTAILFIILAIAIKSSFDLSILLYFFGFCLMHFIIVTIEHFIQKHRMSKIKKYRNRKFK